MNPYVAVLALTLESWDNLKLAVLNNGVQSFGKVPSGSLAHDDALKAQIIQEDGTPIDLDSLRSASAYEVNRRVKSGTFD